jgi:hypothetical protein
MKKKSPNIPTKVQKPFLSGSWSACIRIVLVGFLDPDPHWDIKPDPDPHWNQCESTTLIVMCNVQCTLTLYSRFSHTLLCLGEARVKSHHGFRQQHPTLPGTVIFYTTRYHNFWRIIFDQWVRGFCWIGWFGSVSRLLLNPYQIRIAIFFVKKLLNVLLYKFLGQKPTYVFLQPYKERSDYFKQEISSFFPFWGTSD